MTEAVENEYETDDDEQAAHSATFANQAHAVIFRHFTDLPEDDPWADKVSYVLCDAMAKLEGLAWEELRLRPGAPEAGRIWAAEFDKKHGVDIEAWRAAQDG